MTKARGSIFIKKHKHGGIFSIPAEGNIDAVLKIAQVEIQCSKEGYVTKEERVMELQVKNALSYTPNTVIPGTIQLIEQTEPIDPDNPEAHLSWINGEVERVNGKPVYRTTAYNKKDKVKDKKIS